MESSDHILSRKQVSKCSVCSAFNAIKLFATSKTLYFAPSPVPQVIFVLPFSSRTAPLLVLFSSTLLSVLPSKTRLNPAPTSITTNAKSTLCTPHHQCCTPTPQLANSNTHSPFSPLFVSNHADKNPAWPEKSPIMLRSVISRMCGDEEMEVHEDVLVVGSCEM